MNILNDIRIILGWIAFCSATVGLLQSNMGSLAIPKPIRSATIFRRKIKMFSFMLMSALIITQPNPAQYTNVIVQILIALMVEIVVIMFLISWWREHEISVMPLDPTTEELVNEAIKRSREIAHESKSAIMVVSLVIENLQESGKIDNSTAKLSQFHLETVRSKIDALHGQIKALHPLMEKANESDTTNN